MNAPNDLPELIPQSPVRTPKLNLALAKAQGAMELASKDSTNPHFNSKFADLAACVAAAKKPLADNELAVTQEISNDKEGVTITTRILHSSGEEREQRLTLPVAQRTPQGYGSTITYARRYTYCAALSIAAEEDDDGNAGSGRDTFSKPQPPEVPPKKERRLKIDEPKSVTFGESGGLRGKPIASLTNAEIHSLVELGESRVKESPGALWAASVSACLLDLKAEESKRVEEAIAFEKKSHT